MIGLLTSTILFTFACAAVFFMVTVILGGKITEEQRLVARRKVLIVGRSREEEKKKNKKNKKGRKDKNEDQGFHVKQTMFEKMGDGIFDELMAANIMMKPEEFAMIWVVVAFVPAFLSFVFLGNPLLPIVLAIVGIAIPVFIVKNKQAQRVKQFESQLSDALLICCNCLRSGLTFAQAMENIAQEMEDPIGTEFKRAVNEMNYGASLEEALNNLLDRIDSADLNLTVAAVSVQRQTGGNLSEILEVISSTIRERLKIKSEVRALTSQGRASGLVIGMLPIVIAMMLAVINPDYIMMFITTKAGNIMLIVSVVLEVLGFIAINKVVQIKY